MTARTPMPFPFVRALALVLALVPALAGCGMFGGDEPEPGDQPPAAAAPAPTRGEAKTPPAYESAPLPSASFFER